MQHHEWKYHGGSVMSDYEASINIIGAMDWQRSNADKLQEFIQAKQNWYQKNFSDPYNAWLDDVFNLDTATAFGLSVWSIILDEPIYGSTGATGPDYPDWGFRSYNFNNGNFGTNADGGYNFSTEEIRQVLKLKAFILHMSGNVSAGALAINPALKRIFGDGGMVCIDNRDMSFTYIVYNPSLVSLVYELNKRDLLPRPICIDINSIYNGNIKSWGFGKNHSKFNRGNFKNGKIL